MSLQRLTPCSLPRRHGTMAVHAQCLQNVSMATGTFASQLRGSRPRHTSTAVTAGRAQRFCALSTYNRRYEASAPRHLAISSTLSAAGPQQQQRIGSSASAFSSVASPFGGRPTLAQLASHIGRPRFNALARLASNALGSLRRSTDDLPPPPGVAYAAAAVASPAAPAPAQQVHNL